jgi:uncharacterized protein YjbI with pentapeptide repeats
MAEVTMMANEEHIEILAQGVQAWNEWREANPDVAPDLRGLHMTGQHDVLMNRNADEPSLLFLNGTPREWMANGLAGINLDKADLNGAVIEHVNLAGATLRHSVLRFANVTYTSIGDSDLRGAHIAASRLFRVSLASSNLQHAFLAGNAIHESDMSNCDLTGANLAYTSLCNVNMSGGTLVGCCVHGSAAWNLDLARTRQTDLVITEDTQPRVTVDNLELAQFIYLLLDNKKLRNIIDTITSKVVLILGRFNPERKPVLDSIREELRKRNYTPLMFDFDKPASRDTDETVSLLARMARFIIADITDAKCVIGELKGIVEQLPNVPVQPLLLASEQEYGMFGHITNYRSALEPHLYENQESLLSELSAKVIDPAEALARKLTGR